MKKDCFGFLFHHYLLIMPLLLLTGHPASGKSTIAERLLVEFKEHNPILVSDSSANSEYNRNADHHLDKRRNVDHNNSLRSEVLRLIAANSNSFVIVDSLNYARSIRYQLFTIAKNNRTTFAILFCDVSNETSDFFNSQREDKYEMNVIEDLRSRFERPKPLKGDIPCFELSISQDECKTPRNILLPIDDLRHLLVEGKPMKENQSNAASRKMSSNFIYEVDNCTQKIVKHIIENQHSVGIGGTLTLPWDTDVKFSVKQFHTFPSLNRIRGRFIEMTKHGILDGGVSIDKRFVEYI